MKRRLVFGFGLLAVVVLGALLYTLVFRDSAAAPTTSITLTEETQVADLEATQQTVAVVGTIQCLEPKDNSSTQALSCAIGLQKDDGGAYALNAEDPTTTGSLPTGQRVKVTGVVLSQPNQYQTDGTIKVDSVQPL